MRSRCRSGTLGRMPRRIADLVHLSAPEAACLEAVRSGADTKTRVALGARLDLKQTDVTLRGLATAGLIKKRDRKWFLTLRGGAAAVSVVPDTGGRRGRNRYGKVRPGTSSDRLLALLYGHGVEPNSLIISVSSLAQRGQATGVNPNRRLGLPTASAGGAIP